MIPLKYLDIIHIGANCAKVFNRLLQHQHHYQFKGTACDNKYFYNI